MAASSKRALRLAAFRGLGELSVVREVYARVGLGLLVAPGRRHMMARRIKECPSRSFF